MAESPTAVTQGGLVDLRHGQVCLDLHGHGRIFDYGEKTRLTLDGRPVTPEHLADLLKNGVALSAVVRADNGGLAASVDIASGHTMKAFSVKITPESELPIPAGHDLDFFVSSHELKRLKSKQPRLTVAGLAYQVPMKLTPNGAQATLRLESGLEVRNLPVYLSEGETDVYRGQGFSVNTEAPKLVSGGPGVVGASAQRLPGWVDLEGPIDLLDHRATRITVSGEGKVDTILTRGGRLEFWLTLPTPGTYQVKARIKDHFGRISEYRWAVTKNSGEPR